MGFRLAPSMKIGQYCQRQRCRHVELEQFWQAFASRGFVSDSWAFLLVAVPTALAAQRYIVTILFYLPFSLQWFTTKADLEIKAN